MNLITPLDDLIGTYVYVTFMDGALEKAIFKSWEANILKFDINGKETYIFEHAIAKLVKAR